MHPLDRIEISCSNHHKFAGYWFSADHRTTRAFTLSGYGELSFLECGEEVLLGMWIQRVDFINEEHAAMRPVDGPNFNPVVCRGFKSSTLEWIVPYVTKKGTGMRIRSRR